MSAALLREFFDAAVAAVSANVCMADALAELSGDYVVLGAGKAAASMAAEVEKHVRARGLVVVPYGHALPCRDIEVVEAAHPVPDEAAVTAATRMLELARSLGASDRVLCLISGGGSSVLTLPRPGMTLADKREKTRELLRSGAAIADINRRRIAMSAIKGGQLAEACRPASVMTLIISDVPGNDPALVASGPTVIAGAPPETYRVVATSDDALAAAQRLAESRGYGCLCLGDVEGDARELAAEHARRALDIAAGHDEHAAPCVILSGGETTVTVRGGGRGGRNSEYALALARALAGHERICAIACDTDGIDGSGDHAGAIVKPDTLGRAGAMGLDLEALQAENDSYAVFSALGDLVTTGPTRTNVNDFRAILIAP